MTDAEISKPLRFYLQLFLWSCENISWRCQALGTSLPSCSPKSAGVQETFLKGQGYIKCTKCTGASCCPRVFPVSFLADRLIYLMLFVAFLCGFGYIPHVWSRVRVKESVCSVLGCSELCVQLQLIAWCETEFNQLCFSDHYQLKCLQFPCFTAPDCTVLYINCLFWIAAALSSLMMI